MAEEGKNGRKDIADSQETFGQYLKRVREERGISLEKVAEETKIRVRYLKALEEGDYGLLPGEVYAKGFLRNYARFLGVEFPRHEAIISPKAPKEVPQQKQAVKGQARRPGRQLGWRVFPLLILAGILAVYSLSFLANLYGPGDLEQDLEPQDRNVGIIEPGDGEDIEEEEDNNAAVILVQDTDGLGEYLVTKAPITLQVRVEDSPCWLRVVADGIAVEETLQPGDQREYTASEELQVRAGNPGSLFLKVNEQDLGSVGKAGIPKDFLFYLE